MFNDYISGKFTVLTDDKLGNYKTNLGVHEGNIAQIAIKLFKKCDVSLLFMIDGAGKAAIGKKRIEHLIKR